MDHLTPVAGGRFRVVDLSCELTFTEDGVDIRQEGVTRTAKRTSPRSP